SLIKTVIGLLEAQGITVLDPSPFLASAFCGEGLLSNRKMTGELETDIDFGWKIARRAADLDIGQTIIVKDRAVVAVEGMEGTDDAIERGGLLAGLGTTVIKVSRTHQDPRIDLPAVGLNTIKAMVTAGCAALCIEADRVPLFQKEEALALADAHNIVILAKKA
ncbi:MAG: LpxI family protein, partial [Candidatus Aminicenantes bacterium]|nr:LpxI family protein [Candidatus Aminicenantes bacterium]